MRRLMAYSWPGNVRQLENIVERALAFSHGRPQIDVADLGPEISDRRRRADGAGDVVAGRGPRLRAATSAASSWRSSGARSSARSGNKRQAAKLLNLKRTTLIEKLKRLEPAVKPTASPNSPEDSTTMPPRHAYWTIILEGKPTAFRAHTQEELLPTFKQLQAQHPDAC